MLEPTDYKWIASQIFVWIAVTGSFLATLRFSTYGYKWISFEGNKIIRFFSHGGWLFLLLAIIPGTIGQFARRDISFIAWEAFSEEATKHGTVSGVLVLLVVITVELWLFWTPAHIYISSENREGERNLIFIRLLNVAVGVLLLTPYNPIYRFLE
jgi:hypothetical protein